MMNERKLQVIKKAHQLFIEKGFQATSIQDILDFSGISKGTFYNYFSSKNELLIELFKTIYTKLEKDRADLLIGKDPADINIFIQQIEMQMHTNRANKLISLFEEVFFSKDEELKEFIKRGQLRMIRWIYERFIDLFGEEKKPYLLDCSIMFMGILNHNIKFNLMGQENATASIHRVVKYSVERIVQVVNEVAQTKDQLIAPERLEQWFPENRDGILARKQNLITLLDTMKSKLGGTSYVELLDFIQEELLEAKSPRRFLLEKMIQSLKESPTISVTETDELEKMIQTFYSKPVPPAKS
ncbi:AcrR family transcriptional regulator [Bacillus tianshenii]|uniref:AcrR family transcriptional regulator n=1 Tax=Sutcliffiella tianshenii TaxID=1463404 RepID=A0ABS2NZL0_9BACI|nr:TetR/AcrR family transcriptional regulator [Bacillus tianshenii]MBM7619913.1 AcrR family transcriptional regulator [Bacillus tianshenii]